MSSHGLQDTATGLFAAIAVISFWQGIALALTIIAAMISVVLGCIRIHDRLRYGPSGGYRG